MDAPSSSVSSTDTSMYLKAVRLNIWFIWIDPFLTHCSKHVKSHGREYRCWYRNCTFSAYQEKDVRRHVGTFHRNAKIPCPVVACPYSRNGPHRGISRKDALRRHLLTHGMTLDEVTTLQSLQSQADNRDQSNMASSPQELFKDSDSFLDFFSFPLAEM